MKAIKACRYNDPCADEVMRYAGSKDKVITIDGFIVLIKPSHGLIRPWLRMNLERLRSFGIEGEVIEVSRTGNVILG